MQSIYCSLDNYNYACFLAIQLEELDPKSIRIAVLKEGFGSPGSDPEVDRLVRETIDTFASSSGAHVQEVSIPLHKSSETLPLLFPSVA